MSDEKAESEDPQDQPVDIERINSFSVTAQHTNRFYLTVLDSNVRVAFGEFDPGTGTMRYQTAILLSAANALALAELIGQFVQKAEPTSPDGPNG